MKKAMILAAAMAALAAEAARMATEGYVDRKFAGADAAPRVEMPTNAAARGISFVRDGIDENVAIAIGRDARAAIASEDINSATNNARIRSVSVAVGANADATEIGRPDRSQAVAVGWNAQARGCNSIAIGSGAQHTNETAMTGHATFASNTCDIAVGWQAKATGGNAVALGRAARATGENAVQIGEGTNSEANTLKFRGTTLARNGALAETDPVWNAEKGSYTTANDLIAATNEVYESVAKLEVTETDDYTETRVYAAGMEYRVYVAKEGGDFGEATNTVEVAGVDVYKCGTVDRMLAEIEAEYSSAIRAAADTNAAQQVQIATAAAHAARTDNPHGVTAAQTGAVPDTRTVNGKRLNANITLSAADVGAAEASLAQAVTNLATESSLVYRLYSGSNVVCEVTNYNSAVHAPTMRLLQLNESNEYITVWTETNNLARVARAATNYTDTVAGETWANAVEAFAPRAWSRTTSGMGVEAPSNTTWLSTPTTVIAGGLDYEKHVTSGGAVWVLTSNGMAADFHAQTNNTAYMDLSSADGTPIFRVEKTDAFLVGVNADSVSVDGSTLVIGCDIVGDHPLVRVKASLTEGAWAYEEDSIPAGLATVAWSGSAGNWTCRLTNNTGGNSLFAFMEYLQEGSVKIVNSAPTDISAGVIVNGVKYMPTVSGTTLTWEAAQ